MPFVRRRNVAEACHFAQQMAHLDLQNVTGTVHV